VISIAGAQTLATVIPVGLLVLAFQAREEDRIMGGTPFMERVVRWCRVVLIAIVIASVVAEMACVRAVASGAALRGGTAVLVYLVGYALAFCVAATIMVAVASRSGLLADMEERTRGRDGGSSTNGIGDD
jgi:hypothetical protein